MLKLSIITINYNNSIGLKKTMESVFGQTSNEFEYIIIDGNSSDASKAVIIQYTNNSNLNFNWISETDDGIYHAMNKGIQMAKGDYVQFLNSGDCLVVSNVTENMLSSIPNDCDIFYGNMLKQIQGKIIRDRGFEGKIPTMFDFYTGTLNHSPTYIKRELFKIYGFYDEKLKIVSDWKWYLQVITLNRVIPKYIDIDVTLFDMTGISNVNSYLDKCERKQVLSEILPIAVLEDYERWSIPIDQVKRINRYCLIRKSFRLVERLLFKWEKWFLVKKYR